MPPSVSNGPGSASNLQWLVDENVAPAVTAFLRRRGVDVLDVKEQGWFGSTDAELLTRARQSDRVILTYDADFGALLRLRRRHPGIVIVRLRHLQAQRVIAALDNFLKKHAVKALTNLVVVIGESRIRFRSYRQTMRAKRRTEVP